MDDPHEPPHDPGLRTFQQLIDRMPVPIAIQGPTGDIELMNRNALDFFGKTVNELKGYRQMDVIHPDDLRRVLATLSASLADEDAASFRFEWRARRFDGAYRWVESRGFPLKDAHGHLVQVYCMFIDIDERRRAEQALAASEHELRLIVDTIPGLIAVFSANGELTAVNSQILAYFGATEDELRDWTGGRFTHPDDHAHETATFARAMATGQPFAWETRARRADGVYRWLQTRGYPLKDASGQITRWYNLLTDIDDRKRAEAKLCAREAELSRAYAHVSEAQRLSKTGSFIWDLAADDHNWSDELRRIWEVPPGAALTTATILAATHPDDLAIARAMIDQARHERDDVEAAFRIQTPSGVVKHLHVVGHAMHPHPAQRVFVGAIQDVTERRLAEEALDKARAQLDHASRVMSLGVLTASIAHEVNQPLAGILTNASTCVRMLGADPPNLDGALETAHRTIRDAKRAAEIIARLRTLFGKSELAAAPADLNEAAREVIALTRKELQRHRIALHTRLAAALPTVIGDHVQLQQVILNLLLNACDATCAVDDRPREILVETVHEDGAVRLTIRDTGAGISRAARDKLFEPFFTTKPEGMGIGLSISRSIVERHGGKLWAVQDNGPGAAFAFSIPCASASSAT